jgi:hypothetical protein
LAIRERMPLSWPTISSRDFGPQKLHGGPGQALPLHFFQQGIFFQGLGVFAAALFLENLVFDVLQVLLMALLQAGGNLFLDIVLHHFPGQQVGNLFFDFL